jgi:hypothetical protein
MEDPALKTLFLGPEGCHHLPPTQEPASPIPQLSPWRLISWGHRGPGSRLVLSQ